MKIKKGIIKRLTAFVIMICMFISCMPSNIIFANQQSHVNNVTLQSVPGANNGYSINFSWKNPVRWSSKPDNAAVEADRDAEHTPEGYKLVGKNSTAREGNFNEIQVFEQYPLTSATIIQNLISGSIYSYQVLPYHSHRYDRNNKIEIDEAPYDNAVPAEEVLFMSDIEVEAKGSGNTLTVTWDNPTYGGIDIFEGYRIYYQRGGDKVTNFNTYKDISMNDPALTSMNDNLRPGVRRLTYGIFDKNIVQGEVYAVKVEPLYHGGIEVRKGINGLNYAEVSINEKGYKISYSDPNIKEYRTNDAHIEIPLEVYEDGKDFLKLYWWGLSNTIGNIDRIEIYSGPSEDDIGEKIGTLNSSQAMFVNYWQTRRPKDHTYYQIRIYIDGKPTPISSSIADFDPTVVNVTPNKPNIYPKVNAVTGKPSTLDIYWDIFLRYPYNDTENAFKEPDGTYKDKNVLYDVWVSDSLDILDSPGLPPILERIDAKNLTETTIEDTKTPVYYENVNMYATLAADGTFTTKTIEKNKTYYIKIVARKPVANKPDLSAEPAYASIYVPTDGEIATPPAISKPPLRIKKDAEGKEIITKDSITVEWNTKWYEIYDSKTDSWYSEAVVKNASTLLFGKDINKTDKVVNFHNAQTEEQVRQLLKNAGLSESLANSTVIRLVDLKENSILYEMQVLPFDDINQDGGYEAYIEKIMNSEEGTWNQITPTTNEKGYAEHLVNGLEKNKAYVIILRPYRVLENGKKEAYPTYVIGTTLPDDTDVEIVPTVPILEEVGTSDTSITFRWEEHIPNLEYELVISEVLLKDPSSGGTHIPIEDIKEFGIERVENGKIYMYYKVNDLFPETGYYVWIRSIANNSAGTLYSKWSNPLYMVTDTLKAPMPPDGLGLVGIDNLKIYNKTNDTKYVQADSNYLIIEWLKDMNDSSGAGTGFTGDNFEVLADPDIESTYIVKFNNLIGNKTYYVRAKTILTMTKSQDGKSVKSYSYKVQLSLTKDFKEYVEVIVPQDKNAAGSTVLQKESDWCRTIALFTEYTDDEYDGKENNKFYPLPDDDFELTYDYSSKKLTYRFRSDKEDEEGKDDNSVDQRFISKLYRNKVYNFGIDLTSYQSNEIKIREVIIPYSIISAFGEHKSNFILTANNIVFNFAPDFIETNEIKSMGDFGKNALVRITVTENPSNLPQLSMGESYISKPQSLSITVESPSRVVPIKYTAKNIDVSIRIEERTSLYDKNVDSYIKTDSMSQWERFQAKYNTQSAKYKGATTQIGIFSAIAKSGPIVSGNDPVTTDSINSINSKMYIKDVASFSPNQGVSALQFNNVVSAIANNKKEVTLNSSISEQDYDALKNKGILMPEGIVYRQQGIDALVKLYEAKTKMRIENYNNISQSKYSDIAQAHDYYKTSLLKAEEIGFFGNETSVRPSLAMNLGELFYMVDIIIQDSMM